MKRTRLFIAKMTLLLALLAVYLPVSAARTEAAKTYTYNHKVHILAKGKAQTKKMDMFTDPVVVFAGDPTVLSISSSNSSVLSIKKLKSTVYRFKWKKTGKVTVTYKCKSQWGKKTPFNMKINYTVVNNPIASLKVGGKEYAGKFTNSATPYGSDNIVLSDLLQLTDYKSGVAGKVALKLNKGWSVTSVYVERAEKGKSKTMKKVALQASPWVENA